MKNLRNFTLTLLLSSLSLASFGQMYADDCLDSLDIATGLTPNSDGINDVFSVDFPCPPEQFELTVHNRWGEAVFETSDFKFQWNGNSDKGQALPSGTYFYIVKYTFNSKDVEFKGYLTIMR